jgi:hypothetical protein
MRIVMPRGVAAAAAVLVALLLTGTAQAAGPYEPNDAPESAFGPIGTAGGLHVIDAVGETAEDEDWFSFFVPDGPHDVVVGVEPLTPDASLCVRLHVESEQGVEELESIVVDGEDPGAGELADTVSGPARAFVSVDGCSGFEAPPVSYRITLEGDWPAQDPRPADDPAGSGSPAGAGVRTRCHAAALALRAASGRYRSARHAYRKHHTRANHRRLAAARKARTRSIRKVVRVC